MADQKSITVRAAFIAERIAERLMGKSSGLPTFTDTRLVTPENIVLYAYFQCIGAAWDYKPNVYAIRRIMGELGYLQPISADEISKIGNAIATRLVTPGREEIEIALNEYTQRQPVAKEAIYRIVVTLQSVLSRALVLVREHSEELKSDAIVASTESVIREHAETLRRKRKQMVLKDDYGMEDRTKWGQEIDYFVRRVVLPELGLEDIEYRLLSGIASLVEEIATEEESDTLYSAEMQHISPKDFEMLCAETLKEQGWNTQLTKATGDQGVDVVAARGGLTVVLQCKMYTGSIGNSAVQEVHAGKDFIGADLAVVVGTSEFTASAKELANVLDVLLLHYSQLERFDTFLFSRRRSHAQ
jgi:restriction system protein